MSSLKKISVLANFSKLLKSPEYIRTTSRITDTLGKVISESRDIEVPHFWSQLSVDILVSKYFRKAGLPKTKASSKGYENSLKQVMKRISGSLAFFAKKNKYLDVRSSRILENEVTALLENQFAAFNSPVWFNLGLWKEYKIKTAGENFRFDRKKQTSLEISNNYEFPQSSACFIQSVSDDLVSIFDLAKTEARIFKYGSGTGTNFSNLRGKGELLESGGTSSGLMSFLEVLDRGAGAIKSGGTTRRAAKMVCLDVDHPEILDFIDWKSKEEQKAKALIRAGYDSDFNGEAYRTVSGQNSNNSVRVSDSFMNAVEKNGEWSTRARLDGKIVNTLRAKDIWNKIAQAAWSCADPGVQFDTTINSWHTCPKSGPIRASNPCSEYMFLDNSACNLASLNLVKFQRDATDFSLTDYLSAIRTLVICQDLLVEESSYPTAEIAKNSYQFRPLGLGYANLGALLMRLGLPYDSEGGREWASLLTSILTAQAYLTSTELAHAVGPFDGYRKNKTQMLNVIEMHADAASKIINSSAPRNLHQTSKDLWAQVLKNGKRFGFRNSQVTVLAPTGTIGLLMDCDTTGIEPEYSIVKIKKLAGGGSLKIVNQSITPALAALGYSTSEVESILEYVLGKTGTHTLEGAPYLKPEHLAVFDCASRSEPHGKRMISAEGHLKMMVAVQPFLSGAISKTVNVPSETTVEEIKSIYFRAWKLGLKSIAVYRDGSKSTQPLNVGEVKESHSIHCPDCGFLAEIGAGCARCLNCGSSLGCN